MKKSLNSILKVALEEISPGEENLDKMGKFLKEFSSKIEKKIKKLKIDADLFVGGSFSKNTLVRKSFYDIDVFLRFDKKYSEENFKKLTRKILGFTRGVSTVKGSRDYFRMKGNSFFHFELVPVRKIKNPREALNITDLSYSHVNYIKRKVKNKEILDGIKLAKAFCYANRTYGAESYVHGFSGYSLELLVYHFGSFEKFLKALSKVKDKKLIIDIEKHYKKGNVLLDMNGSKLESPIILVDPTFKSRNVLAALSQETFDKFQKDAKKFLKIPSANFFKLKRVNFEKVKNGAKKSGFEFIKIEIETKKEKGDVAGTKLLKFFNHLKAELRDCFEIKKSDFEYGGEKKGEGYLVLKRKMKKVFSGPKVVDKKNALKFNKRHGKTFSKKGRLYAEKKINYSGKEFLKSWKNKKKNRLKEMYVSGFKIN